MTEIEFIVEEAPEGGYTARAVGEDIFRPPRTSRAGARCGTLSFR